MGFGILRGKGKKKENSKEELDISKLREQGMSEIERLKKEINELREELKKYGKGEKSEKSDEKKTLKEKLKAAQEKFREVQAKMAEVGQRADAVTYGYLLAGYYSPPASTQQTQPAQPSRPVRAEGNQPRDLLASLSDLFSLNYNLNIGLGDIDDLVYSKKKQGKERPSGGQAVSGFSSSGFSFNIDIDDLVYGKRRK
jgi:hypothetical protein